LSIRPYYEKKKEKKRKEKKKVRKKRLGAKGRIKADLLVVHGRLNTSAKVVPANDDVLDLQILNGVLEHREGVEVCVVDAVGNVPVDEDLTRGQFHELVGTGVGEKRKKHIRS